jgi:hypothetical protein
MKYDKNVEKFTPQKLLAGLVIKDFLVYLIIYLREM